MQIELYRLRGAELQNRLAVLRGFLRVLLQLHRWLWLLHLSQLRWLLHHHQVHQLPQLLLQQKRTLRPLRERHSRLQFLQLDYLL